MGEKDDAGDWRAEALVALRGHPKVRIVPMFLLTLRGERTSRYSLPIRSRSKNELDKCFTKHHHDGSESVDLSIGY